ncbi:hypothetical protein J6590_079507 [Homalodisca vitripennis]|nr:hypothetical protein J6590_079507 [Homalodisca vitripennis]
MGLKQQCKELTEQNLVKVLVDYHRGARGGAGLRAQIAGLEARVNYSVGTLTPSPATLSETPLMDLGVDPDDLYGRDASGCCDAQSTVNLEAPFTNEKIVDKVAVSSGELLGCEERSWPGWQTPRRGEARLAALFEAVMDFGLRLEIENSAAVYPLSSISNSQTPPMSGNGHYEMPGYTFLRADRSLQSVGGFAVYIKDCLRFERVELTEVDPSIENISFIVRMRECKLGVSTDRLM